MTNKQTLKDFYRSPKLYIQLPSGGKFYSNDIIDWPENNELPILAMTPRDELITRNPDALLNGDAVLRLIESCVPNIKRPEEIIAPDMELLLVAIRAASEKNRTLTVNRDCPKCEHENSFDLDLSIAVQDFESVEGLSEVLLSNGLTIGIRPANYMYSIQTAKAMIEQANTLARIANEEFENSDQKIKSIGSAFDQLAQYNFSVLINSIKYIKIPGNDDRIEDKEEILEFLDNVESKIGTEVDNAVSAVNNGGINKVQETQCENCEHTFEIPIDFDPVAFFLTS